MKYILFSLALITFAHAEPSGECRKLFKSSKKEIKQAESTLEKAASLYARQEEALVSKNIDQAKAETIRIDNHLSKSKALYKAAIKKLNQAFTLCSGRSGKAKRLIDDSKEGIKTILFKENFNKETLKNI